MNNDRERLKDLYERGSKHSNYQVISKVLQDIIGTQDVHVTSRYEMERLDYILENLDIQGNKILDVGSNTGFFSFEFLNAGALEVVSVEGNKDHAVFIQEASGLLGLNITVSNKYLNFKDNLIKTPYNTTLLFNVLHHIGDDFGKTSICIDEAKGIIEEAINYFYDKTEFLIFQLGFCWKGDRNHLLFKNGTKQEMIDFIKNGTEKFWNIDAIGIAERDNGKIVYKDLNDHNIKRDDSLGEFLNRPIFILSSKK